MRARILKYTALALIVFAAYMGTYFVYPDISELAKKNPGKTAFMLWREKQWAEDGRKMTITQRWVPLSRVSPLLLKAVLIGEDDKFYKHEGFDYQALEQAFEKNLKEGRFAAGASTISQQLTKNLFLSPEKSLTRKVKEAILTWRMEHTLSKRRILELYVNVAEWGDGIFGIEAASRHYFHKSASALTAMEAARLASVLPNPIRFNPLGDQKYVSFRSNLIHNIMVRRGVAIADFQEVMDTKDTPGVETSAQPLGGDDQPGQPEALSPGGSSGAPSGAPSGATAGSSSGTSGETSAGASSGTSGAGQGSSDAAAAPNHAEKPAAHATQ